MKRIILFFLVLVLLSACTRKQADQAIALLPGVGDDPEIADAVENMDVNACDNVKAKDEIAKNRKKNDCIRAVAYKSNNWHECQRMKDEFGGTAAESIAKCVLDIAEKLGEEAVCDSLDNVERKYRDACISSVATVNKDASACSRIQTPFVYDECINNTARADRNFEICGNFEDIGKRARCQWEVASLKRDKALCERVEREDFRNNCYKEVAVYTQDAELCSQITTERTKERCLEASGAR